MVFSFGVGLALRKADFALKKISPLPYCQPPLAFSFVLIPTLSEWSGLALAYPHQRSGTKETVGFVYALS